jgi:hypothetical protein
VLRLQATSESDPFFLHSLALSEEDFASLKARLSFVLRSAGRRWVSSIARLLSPARI